MHKKKLVHSKGNFRLWVFLLLLLVTTLLQSCHYFGMDPESSLPQGRRDYVWTVDTLGSYNYDTGLRLFYAYGNLMGAMLTNDSLKIYRKQGMNWSISSELKVPVFLGFGPKIFYNNDIWLSSERHFLRHHQSIFSTVSLIPDTITYQYEVSATGIDENNTRYFSGTQYKFSSNKGFIVKEEGNSWKQIIPEITEQYSDISQIAFSSGKMYFLARDYFGGCAVYSHSDNRTSLLARFSTGTFSYVDMNVVDNKVYVLVAEGLFTVSNGELILLYPFTVEKYYREVIIAGSNNVFISYQNKLMHFNGNDLAQIYAGPDDVYYRGLNIFYLNNELYYSFYSGGKIYIAHGVLK